MRSAWVLGSCGGEGSEGEVSEGGDEGGALGEGGGEVCGWRREFLSVMAGTSGVTSI